MAQVTALTWIPRSYLHLYETYRGIDKTGLKITEREYDGKKVSFKLEGFESYDGISFTQSWSGVHYFTTKLPDTDLEGAARKYLADMQKLFVEVILKNCHTVTYKQIIADILSVDFHIIIQTNAQIPLEGMRVEDAVGLKIGYKPEAAYSSGEITYLVGSEDESHLEPMLYHAYSEVASDFLMSVMKSMIRLYHEADQALSEASEAKTYELLMNPLNIMDKVVLEATEKNGKIRHAMINFKFKEQEYYSQSFDETQQAIVKALKIADSFRRLEADSAYMSVLWNEILRKRLKNIDEGIRSRAELSQKGGGKKGWF
jgi:hypothetical protein